MASRRVTAKGERFLSVLMKQATEAVKTMQPHTLDYFAGRLQDQTQPTGERDAAFVSALTGGRTYTAAESAVIQASALINSYNLRRELLADALSTNDVARLLNVSRQTPNDRAKAGTLLAVQENGVLRFPAWQFDPEGENGVLPGLSRVLQTLDASSIAKASWLTRPNRDLEGKRPIDLVRARRLEPVLAAAKLVGV